MSEDGKTVNLALQGGGAHGAFTWGALDRLLEEERLGIEAISGTSAGAMNGAMLKTGWMAGGREGAKRQLDLFWGGIRRRSHANVSPFGRLMGMFSRGAAETADRVYRSPGYFWSDWMQRTVSPYEWNPFNYHPLRELLEELVDWNAVCSRGPPYLHVCATNVRSGKIRVFRDEELSVDVLLASACLPTLFQAIEIRGEHYWDGGYMGNPALFPLFDQASRDIVIVHVNPIERPDVPTTAPNILNRINEISFNSSLLRELRAIDFVRRMIATGHLQPGEMKDILIHSVRNDAAMAELNVGTKLAPEPALIDHLRALGRAAAHDFLTTHWADIGERGSVDLREMFQ